MTDTIGVVGVGNMGSAFAGNLIDAGYDVVVFDLVDEKIQRLVAAGARAADSAAVLASEAETVISSLPTAEAVETAYLGARGVLDGAASGMLIIEMSTTKPTVSEAVHDAATEHGVDYVDAPVIGLPYVARAAELVIMVGGSDEAVDRATPILESLGKELHHVGGAGDGHRAKLLNNVVLLAEDAIAAEVFALAGTMGLDRETLLDIVTGGMAGSETIEVNIGKALTGDFETTGGFPIDLARKDLRYALEMSATEDFSMPLTALVNEQYTMASMAGRGDDDYGILMQVLEAFADRSEPPISE